MDHDDVKLSGDGSTFLMLLHEDESAKARYEETQGLDGKDRLRHAWHFEGERYLVNIILLIVGPLGF